MIIFKSSLLLAVCFFLAACGMNNNRTNASTSAQQKSQPQNTQLDEPPSVTETDASPETTTDQEPVLGLTTSTNGVAQISTSTNVGPSALDVPLANANTNLSRQITTSNRIGLSPVQDKSTNNVATTRGNTVTVADNEEVLKRLILVQQDGQKLYESLAAADYATWWKVLELDWQALVTTQNTGALAVSTAGLNLRDNVAREDLRSALQNVIEKVDEMINTLSANQSLSADAWPKLSQQLAKVALLLYAPASSANSTNSAISNGASVSLGAPQSETADHNSATNSTGSEAVPPAQIVPRQIMIKPGTLSPVGLIL